MKIEDMFFKVSSLFTGSHASVTKSNKSTDSSNSVSRQNFKAIPTVCVTKPQKDVMYADDDENDESDDEEG